MPTNYQLNNIEKGSKETVLQSLQKFLPFLNGESRSIAITSIAVLMSSLATLLAPIIIAHTIDTYIPTGDYSGILMYAGLLFVIFLVGSFASYIQTKSMGGVGRRVLYNLRNTIFLKLQNLPV